MSVLFSSYQDDRIMTAKALPDTVGGQSSSEDLLPPVFSKGEKGGRMNVESLIAILSLCITCFMAGYTIGSRNSGKKQK